MARMLPGIETVEQHQEQLRDAPDAYRPERCPHCGKGGMYRHGHYERNAPRGEGMAFSLGSLFIPRFYCPTCQGTCSRMPACLSPRRQYWWKRQQAVLERLFRGESIREVARRLRPVVAGVNPRLFAAAVFRVQAHNERLVVSTVHLMRAG